MEPGEFPIHCACGFSETWEQAAWRLANDPRWQQTVARLNCTARGQILATIDGRTAGCGCAATMVPVYRCLQFDEPVLIAAADRCRNKLLALIPGYAGRLCRNCEEPKQGTPPPAGVGCRM